MSVTKHLTQLIESLEKREFDEIVKIYLEEEYAFKKIVFTDGKNDGGIDIKVFDFNNEKIRTSLQHKNLTQKQKKIVLKKNYLKI